MLVAAEPASTSMAQAPSPHKVLVLAVIRIHTIHTCRLCARSEHQVSAEGIVGVCLTGLFDNDQQSAFLLWHDMPQEQSHGAGAKECQTSCSQALLMEESECNIVGATAGRLGRLRGT